MLHLVRKRFPAGEKPLCPWCKDVPLRRLGRIGWMERVVLPLFGYYPWECEWCQRISHLRLRGVLRGGRIWEDRPSTSPERSSAIQGI